VRWSDADDKRVSPSLRQAVVLVCGLALGFSVLLVSGLLKADDLLVRGELGPSESLIAKDFGASDNPGMTGFDVARHLSACPRCHLPLLHVQKTFGCASTGLRSLPD